MVTILSGKQRSTERHGLVYILRVSPTVSWLDWKMLRLAVMKLYNTTHGQRTHSSGIDRSFEVDHIASKIIDGELTHRKLPGSMDDWYRLTY